MVAVVEVDSAGEVARQRKVTDEEGLRTPPLPQPVAAARKHRQPTPDHPPYCWMIGEAIDAMGEEGGLEEDSISAFIRARYPGVPAAHNRLLRHYLDKHVAEGFFVCTAAGRYERAYEENVVMEHPVEQAAVGSYEPAHIGSPVAEPKRGRGRPRRDGSSSTSPASKKDGSAGALSTTPKHRAAATAEDYVPTSPVAVDDKDGSPLTPKRRRLSRVAPRLAAAVDSVPTSLVAVADKKDGSLAASSTPKRHGKCRTSARLATAEDSVPMLQVAVVDKEESQAASLTPKCRGRLRKLGIATTTDNSGRALVADKKDKEDGGEVPYTLDKEHEPPRDLALVVVGHCSATTSKVMDKACAEISPTTPDGGQPLKLALVTTTDMPVSTSTSVMDKDGGNAPSFNLALVAKDDGICTTPLALERSSQACVVALVAADHGSAPVLVADKRDGLEEAPSATYKHVRKPGKAASAPTAGKKAGRKTLCKAASAPTAGKTSRKTLSVTPKVSRLERKPAVMVCSDCCTLTPVSGKKAGRKVSFASPKQMPVIAGGCSPASIADQVGTGASVTLKMKSHGRPRKLYPVTADEILGDPACVLLALPAST